MLLITGVGFLIHLYAVGYMAHDAGRRRFFGYFNLFVAAMLLLVLGNNYVMLYFGWEGVGLASYLLISFWYDRPSAATAGKKAFLMNRVGDAGLAIAIFLMFATLGTGQYDEVFNGVGQLWPAAPSLALGLLLLLGACGKSGQFPLQAWLPDAMEGPTPVSALIHAATMVTAGVYLIARSNPIFIGQRHRADRGGQRRRAHPADRLHHRLRQGRHQAGAGLVDGQPDRLHVPRRRPRRRRVRAGHHPPAGARLLQGQHVPRRRLGHARHERPGRHPPLRRPVEVHEDHLDHLRTGLARHHRHPAAVRLLLQGADHRGRLRAARAGPAWLFGGAALLGAGLTAFYMTRLFVLTFHGPKRWTEDIEHPHESPPVMTIPLILLAVGSVGAGCLMATSVAGLARPRSSAAQRGGARAGASAHALITALSHRGDRARRRAGLGAVPQRHRHCSEQPAGPAGHRRPHATSTRDAFNEAVFEKPGIYLTRALVYLDNRGIDGLVNGLAAAVGGGSGRLRRLQTGFVRSYATVDARRRAAGAGGVPGGAGGVAGVTTSTGRPAGGSRSDDGGKAA